MELFRIHKTIPFMKYSKILNAISFISFFIRLGSGRSRFAFSIEFTGGLVVEVNYRMPSGAGAARGLGKSHGR